MTWKESFTEEVRRPIGLGKRFWKDKRFADSISTLADLRKRFAKCSVCSITRRIRKKELDKV